MIALGCDHGGFQLMQEVVKYLEFKGLAFENYGCFSEEAVDYPEYAKKVAQKVVESDTCDGEKNIGILICGTGIGMSMVANKIKGVRAALVADVFSAKATREHNDANILVMGGRTLTNELAIEILKTFLETEFSFEERHVKRISQIEN